MELIFLSIAQSDFSGEFAATPGKTGRGTVNSLVMIYEPSRLVGSSCYSDVFTVWHCVDKHLCAPQQLKLQLFYDYRNQYI